MMNTFFRGSLCALAIGLCAATVDSQPRFLGRSQCASLVCPADICQDGSNRRQIGENCCACPRVEINMTVAVTTDVRSRCASAECPQDVCHDGRGRRQMGENCCACPAEKCASVQCPADICQDGSNRRQIGENCCACQEVETNMAVTSTTSVTSNCALAKCPQDLCYDGSGRRQIGENCCACPEEETNMTVTLTTTVASKCALAKCPQDICHDGSGRRQIGDNCCACPAITNRSLGEPCGPCLSPTWDCGSCKAGLECRCVGLCADQMIEDSPMTCVASGSVTTSTRTSRVATSTTTTTTAMCDFWCRLDKWWRERYGSSFGEW